jgi:hypothetical protein
MVMLQKGRKGQQGCPSAELKIDGTPQRGDAARRTEIQGAWAKEKARTEANAVTAKGKIGAAVLRPHKGSRA